MPREFMGLGMVGLEPLSQNSLEVESCGYQAIIEKRFYRFYIQAVERN